MFQSGVYWSILYTIVVIALANSQIDVNMSYGQRRHIANTFELKEVLVSFNPD